MSTNYIEVYKSNNELIAKIHKNGKVCTLTNPNNIKKLIDICHKHNMSFKGKKRLEGNVNPIIQEFDSYYIANKRRNQRLKVIKENLKEVGDKFTLVKKNKHIGKIIITTTLATTLGISSIALINNKKSDTVPVTYQTQNNIEEVVEYVDEDNIIKAEIQETENNNYEDGIVVNEETINEDELDQMLQTDVFSFSYTDRTDYENITNAKRYEDLFIKYGNMYGVDSNLLMAIAAQENCGKHFEALNGKYATGIMQIERSANLNSTITAYNIETGQTDSVYITQEAIEDLETNIQIGTMKISNQLKEYNYNIPLALQSYNLGSGNMAKSLSMCSDLENIPIDDLKSNTTNPEWLDYRAFLGVGDSQYVEHVFSFIPSGTVLTVVDNNGNNITLQIVNESVNDKTLN